MSKGYAPIKAARIKWSLGRRKQYFGKTKPDEFAYRAKAPDDEYLVLGIPALARYTAFRGGVSLGRTKDLQKAKERCYLDKCGLIQPRKSAAISKECAHHYRQVCVLCNHWKDFEHPEHRQRPEHRCGVRGFDGMRGDRCPACEERPK